MTLSLRPYQDRTIGLVKACLRAKRRRVLVCVPTGGGKTALSSHILISALAKGSRSMFVAHRIELIDQTVATFMRFGVSEIGVVRASDLRADLSQPIQICSVQTLARRPALKDIRIVVIDECHRSLAKSYKDHLFRKYPDAIFLGMSATPIGPNGKPLTDWEEIVVGATYSQLIEAQHIVAPLCRSTPLLPDLSKVHTSEGDYNQKELEEAINKGVLIGNVVQQWIKHAGGRRTILFAVSVAHSLAIVQQFIDAGVRAEHLDGETPADIRAAILARLKSGETQLVSNVAVLQEGFDAPWVKCVVLTRPTKSLSLYIQEAGRGLRPWNENTPPDRSWQPDDGPSVVPVVHDHAGCFDRFQKKTGDGRPHADREWSLTGKPAKCGAPPMKMCPACYAYIGVSAAECPHCGHVFVAPVVESLKIDHVPVDLALRGLVVEDGSEASERLAWVRAAAKKARTRGWKWGSVPVRFREQFGEEAPREWIDAVRADYKRDIEWKGRVKAKAPEREALAAMRAHGDPVPFGDGVAQVSNALERVES